MAFAKSVFWLVGCGGFAYLLLETITPKDTELIKSLPEGQVHHRPDLNQRAAFVEVLKRAANPKTSMIQDKQSLKTSSDPIVVEK